MAVEVSNLERTFPATGGIGLCVFRNLSFHVNDGEFASIIGPNGCGKSTLFDILAGLQEPTAGEVRIEADGTKEDRVLKVGYMMQKDCLLPWRTVLGNVQLGLEIQGISAEPAAERMRHYLRELALDGMCGAYPSRLSGGERQKVALARTLVTSPDVLLLDEPLSAIDYESRLEMEGVLVSLVKREGKTVLFVTHDIGEAIAVSDRILIFGPKPEGLIGDYEIDLGLERRDPIASRGSPRFAEYFSRIWAHYRR